MLKFSFVIPVYNCEKYLDSCISSLLNNVSSDYEILLIDDGSPDSSGKIADHLAVGNGKIKTYHKKNGGAASARNFGIEKAKGEYILFIDGDDTLDAGFLDKIETYLTEKDTNLIIYGMSFDYYEGEQCTRSEKLSCAFKGCHKIGKIKEDYHTYFENNTLSSACNKVFKSNILRKYNLRFNEQMTLYEDYDFVLRYLTHIEEAWFVDQAWYHYRIQTNNAHFKSRVGNLLKLHTNMHELLISIEAFAENSVSVLGEAASLYLEILYQSLYQNSDLKQLETRNIKEYCSDDIFQRILSSGVTLNESEKVLLERIQDEKFSDIFKDIRRRQQKAHFRKLAKNVLKKVGLYH